MTSIVVTGANGFVGRQLSTALLAAGYSVRGLVRTSRDGAADVRSVDYSDPASISVALHGADCVVHVAGLAHVDSRHLARAEEAFRCANVAVSRHVATACVMADVPRIVLLSSAGVLGPESPAGGFTDLSPAQPYDPYTRSKLAAERTVTEIALPAGIGLTILRPPMIYGDQAPGSFARLSRLLDQGWPLPVGALEARRSAIGIYNLCEAIIAALESDACGAEPILVADEPPVTVADFVRELARARARVVRVPAVPAGLLKFALVVLGRRADYRRLFGAFELRLGLAQRKLGWAPRHTLSEQLARTVREEGLR